MALMMVQGHVFDSLLTSTLREDPAYRFQLMFHGSTAPGFLFASGFVAGLPRAPLSLKAGLRRARRLLFVFAVGYALHLPYFSIWKTLLESDAAQRRAFFAVDALQVIAVSQLAVLALQFVAGRAWVAGAAIAAAGIVAAGPFVWDSGVSGTLHPGLGAYLDQRLGSTFPLFPFAAFVLAGTVAGAAVGRQEPARRHRRALVAGAAFVAVGAVLGAVLWDRVWFWGVSPGYALLRMGGLLLLLRGVEALSNRDHAVVRALALLGHETLLVYVLHLMLLYGGIVGLGVLAPLAGTLSFGEAGLVLAGLVAVLLGAAWLWHTSKAAGPQRAQLALIFVSIVFVHELLVRPW